jgi:hypothetical protein
MPWMCCYVISRCVGLFFQRSYALCLICKKQCFSTAAAENEEKQYLKDMANGDEHARGLLIEHNLRLVAHIVKKFDNTGEVTEGLDFHWDHWADQGDRELFKREGNEPCDICGPLCRK